MNRTSAIVDAVNRLAEDRIPKEARDIITEMEKLDTHIRELDELYNKSFKAHDESNHQYFCEMLDEVRTFKILETRLTQVIGIKGNADQDWKIRLYLDTVARFPWKFNTIYTPEEIANDIVIETMINIAIDRTLCLFGRGLNIFKRKTGVLYHSRRYYKNYYTIIMAMYRDGKDIRDIMPTLYNDRTNAYSGIKYSSAMASKLKNQAYGEFVKLFGDWISRYCIGDLNKCF